MHAVSLKHASTKNRSFIIGKVYTQITIHEQHVIGCEEDHIPAAYVALLPLEASKQLH
jgi:hypothetical protein